jgi:L-2-hydroxycarboxylate dehydrogenase (NAD+)
MSSTRIPFAHLQNFISLAMQRLGLPEGDANIVGRLMSEAELQGSDGHGVIRLLPYARRILEGGMNLRPQIRAKEERAAMALLDGDNGMGHLVMQRATQLAITKAKIAGIAWVGAFNSNHAGPASLYPRMALDEGMIGLYFAVGNANHLPPWGGLDMLLSTNPIAVAIPTLDEPPVVLDMATTVAAYGKVKAKAQKGEMMPEGWMIDREGKPLTDPNRAGEGFLLPIGGYKGYGLSLIVGLLAGTLNGAAMGSQVIDFNADYKTTTNTGQAICVIDPAAFGDPTEFKKRVDTVARELRGSARMPKVDRIWLPGEQSYERRAQNLEQGVPIATALIEKLDQFAKEHNMPLLRDIATVNEPKDKL